MNTRMKKFIEKINREDALNAEFMEVSRKIENMAVREDAIAMYMLPFAKKCGFDFSVEDFALPEGEMDEAELLAVSGGLNCQCTGAGAGDNGCPCLHSGVGENGADKKFSCHCCGTGMGQEAF